MAHHVINYDEQCKSCQGTGLYVGLAERDGAAVVCHSCHGTGGEHVTIEYDDFVGRLDHPSAEWVVETNPGIGIGKDGETKTYTLSDFGGMPYDEWRRGEPFPRGSEMRQFTCPAWWYQCADYDKKPDWKECVWGRQFSSCGHFCEKEKCWQRWDSEQ